MVYSFGFIWSKLGYAAIRFRSPSILARQVWSSSKWLYLVNCSPLLNVVSLKERNSRCFEDNERSILDLKFLFFRTLLDWLVAMQNQSFPSFIDFLDSYNFCT